VRQKYDQVNARDVRETRVTRLSHLGARHDLTVPIVVDGRVEALLCSGPFLLQEPTVEVVAQEWRTLFGSAPQPLDNEFFGLAKGLLDLEVLEPDALVAYGELLEILGQAFSNQGDPDALVRRLEDLRDKRISRTLRVRERRASALLDEKSSGSWSGGRFLPTETEEVGFERVPNLVMAATIQADHARGDDPVTALLEGRRFQCCAADLASTMAETLVTPLGDHAVYLMSHVSWRGQEQEWRRASRRRIAEIASGIGKRFGATPIIGVSSLGQPDGETPRLGREARHALDLAIRSRKPSVLFDDTRDDQRDRQGRRRALSFESVSQSARRLLDDFSSSSGTDLTLSLDTCLETLVLRSAGDARVMRTHLESLLPPLMDHAFRSAGLEPHLVQEFSAELDELLTSSGTVPDLVGVAKATFVRLCSIRAKSSASRELRLAAALRYVEQHCSEPLTVTRLAREAGLSRAHFSELFRAAYGVTFSEHLRRVRLNTATTLLRTTSLNATQVAHRAGFASVTHFHRAFKDHTGRTPKRYREEAS